MRTYKLDDLQDWGRILEELEELRKLRLLDEHQDGLKRILRYRRNWRLRECALHCVKEVTVPRKELVQEVCSIICDEDVYPELRMLAVDTIRELARINARITSLPYYRGTTILEEMEALVDVPMHPLLQRKIVRAVEEIALKEAGPDDGKADSDQ